MKKGDVFHSYVEKGIRVSDVVGRCSTALPIPTAIAFRIQAILPFLQSIELQPTPVLTIVDDSSEFHAWETLSLGDGEDDSLFDGEETDIDPEEDEDELRQSDAPVAVEETAATATASLPNAPCDTAKPSAPHTGCPSPSSTIPTSISVSISPLAFSEECADVKS